MFKKNQLALILITLVLMLCIYFIRTPDSTIDKPGDVSSPDASTTGRLENLTAMRLTLKKERTDALLALDAIIASPDSTTKQVNAAIEEKKQINDINECELLLELEIINLGYQDAFVHATDNGINITVVSDEHSVAKANQVILMAMSNFTSCNNVCVEFETVSEVMGNVDEAA